MDTQRIVLAYNGNAASCAAVKWLQEFHHAEVAALIVGVGQTDDLEEVRARAQASGAVRAHVVDRTNAFARDAIASLITRRTRFDEASLGHLSYPVIAAALREVAAIEGAEAVAHASTGRSLDESLAALDPSLRVIAPAREWIERGVDLSEYVTTRHLSPGAVRTERNLVMRRPLPAASTAAQVTIGFEEGVPVSVNGVAMELRDLIECVSVISGQYSAATVVGAPGLELLQAAYAACGGRDSATVELVNPA